MQKLFKFLWIVVSIIGWAAVIVTGSAFLKHGGALSTGIIIGCCVIGFCFFIGAVCKRAYEVKRAYNERSQPPKGA